MTFQEMIDMQNRLEHFISSSNIGFAFENSMAASIARADYPAMAVASLETFGQTLNQISDIALSNVCQSLETLSDSISELSASFEYAMAQALLDAATNAIAVAEPFLTPMDEKHIETALPLTEEVSSKRLSLSDALAILSILITIFLAVTSSIADKQQNEEQLHVLTTLADSINFLAGSIDLNSEKLEAIDDDLKSIKGVVHCPCQSDCGKTQQQDREEQSDTDSLQPSDSPG